MKKIYVVGSLNTDLVISCPYLPAAGETLTGSGFLQNGGGKGANQATACGKLGGKVAMCGVVGADDFGKALKQNLNAAGVDTDHIRAEAGVSTGIAVIVVTQKDNRIILDKGANACLSFSDIDAFLQDAQPNDIYLTQLENPIDVVGYGLRRAKEKGLYTVLNPAPADRAIAEYFDAVDLITPNEGELALLGGKEALFAGGISVILTTLGGDGFELATAKEEKTYPCPKIIPVDTTAAGDTLCGGLCVGLSLGKSLEESALFGSRAASLACTRPGAQQSIPTLAELEAWQG